MRNALIWLIAISATLLPRARAGANDRPTDYTHPLFSHQKIWNIHLTLSPAALYDMEPTKYSMIASLFRPAATQPSQVERLRANAFGYQYAYVKGNLDFEGQVFKDVAVRFKGNSSFQLGKGLHKPFKIDLDRYVPGQSLGGVEKINLHNNSFDTTMLREALSYQLFHEAGIASPRTGFAILRITVPDKHNRECVGVYTLIEEVNKAFLKERFGSSAGLLMKCENALNMPHLGDDWAKYKARYEPQTNETPELTKQVIEFTKLIHDPDAKKFEQQIGQYLEIDEFLRFLAMNTLLSNMDSLLSTGHNYYLYVHPETRKIHFIPWDLNLSFGSFGWLGSKEELMNLSIHQPHAGTEKLIERILAIEAHRAAYDAHLKKFVNTIFQPAHLHKRIDAAEKVVEAAAAIVDSEQKVKEARRGPTTQPFGLLNVSLKEFVTARVASVEAQLAGKITGYAPSLRIDRLMGGEERARKMQESEKR
jgi:spore coat protein H